MLHTAAAWAVLVPPEHVAAGLDNTTWARNAAAAIKSTAVSVFAKSQPAVSGASAVLPSTDSALAASVVTSHLPDAATFPLVALGAMHTLRHCLLHVLIELHKPVADADTQVCVLVFFSLYFY